MMTDGSPPSPVKALYGGKHHCHFLSSLAVKTQIRTCSIILELKCFSIALITFKYQISKYRTFIETDGSKNDLHCLNCGLLFFSPPFSCSSHTPPLAINAPFTPTQALPKSSLCSSLLEKTQPLMQHHIRGQICFPILIFSGNRQAEG